MANHKSALKRARQNLKRYARNKSMKTQLRTGIKQYAQLLQQKDAEQANSRYPAVQKLIDKAVTKGVLHANTANRYKSRLVLKVNALGKG